ncbi:MAG: response regulator [Rhizobacter sp.]|nr:response regulator [Chlorobiales bacterium]
MDQRNPQPAQHAVSAPPKRRILITDDDEQIHLFFKSALASLPVSLTFAHNGLQALAEVKSSRYDLIMLDLLMPESSGGDFMREVKLLAESHPPIIIMSSIMDADLVRNCLRAGASDFITKPITPSGIREKIRAILYLDDLASGNPA